MKVKMAIQPARNKEPDFYTVDVMKSTGEMIVYGDNLEGLCSFCAKDKSCDHHKISCRVWCG